MKRTPIRLASTIPERFVKTMVLWNEFIVTGSHYIILWNMDGSLLCSSSKLDSSVSCMTIWNHTLVTASNKMIRYWKIRSSQDNMKLVLVKEINFYLNILCFAVWDNMLYVTGIEPEGVIKSYNKHGRHIQSYHRLHGDMVMDMIVFRGLLWSGSADTTICAWKRNWFGYKLKCVKTFSAHSRPVVTLRAWGHDRIASGSRDSTVRIWSVDGDCLFVFQTDWIPNCLTPWTEGRLVCTTTCLDTQGKAEFIIWNHDGSLFHLTHQEYPSMELLAIGNRLLESSVVGISVWETRDWNVERVLWIGLKKNSSAECCLAKLPVDIFVLILRYLYIHFEV